jgi:hypothetical protein
MSNKLLTENLSAAMNGATTATIEIETSTGNLTVDDRPEGTQVLRLAHSSISKSRVGPCNRSAQKAATRL